MSLAMLDLRDTSYKIRYVSNFPAGMPGDISITSSWRSDGFAEKRAKPLNIVLLALFLSSSVGDNAAHWPFL